MNPYLTLGVAADADDAAIRRAYLEAIRRAPPEHEPQRFQAVSDAYAKIKDQTSRLRFALLDETAPGSSPLDAFVRYAQLCPQRPPPPHETLLAFLQSCTKT